MMILLVEVATVDRYLGKLLNLLKHILRLN